MYYGIDEKKSVNQTLNVSFPNHITLTIKREDLIHPVISGNKWRKLKYNLLAARQAGQDTLLTFGGAYSNHIAAVAAAGREFGFNSIGIIRGEELASQVAQNPTLAAAQANRMQLQFVSRADYRMKHDSTFINALSQRYGSFYLLPEGGTNQLAIQGCAEILTDYDKQHFEHICCAAGTGGTIAGIIQSAAARQQVIGFSALKGDFLADEVKAWLSPQALAANWRINSDYHFGGYGKTRPELFAFIQSFSHQTGMMLDPVYTGKMLFGIFDLIQRGYFAANSRILAIHTGGVQGNASDIFKMQLQRHF